MLRFQSLMARLALAWFAFLTPEVGHADAAPNPGDRWLAWLDADPLALATFAAHEGDDAVLSRLAPTTDPALCRIAIEATPFLRAPELALLPLATLAAGRDPDLAEASARRAREIAQALNLEGLSHREVLASTLTSARNALDAASRSRTVRVDLRQLAAEAALLLGALGVPRSTTVVP
jgi:hypothetical protein